MATADGKPISMDPAIIGGGVATSLISAAAAWWARSIRAEGVQQERDSATCRELAALRKCIEELSQQLWALRDVEMKCSSGQAIVNQTRAEALAQLSKRMENIDRRVTMHDSSVAVVQERAAVLGQVIGRLDHLEDKLGDHEATLRLLTQFMERQEKKA